MSSAQRPVKIVYDAPSEKPTCWHAPPFLQRIAAGKHLGTEVPHAACKLPTGPEEPIDTPAPRLPQCSNWMGAADMSRSRLYSILRQSASGPLQASPSQEPADPFKAPFALP